MTVYSFKKHYQYRYSKESHSEATKFNTKTNITSVIKKNWNLHQFFSLFEHQELENLKLALNHLVYPNIFLFWILFLNVQMYAQLKSVSKFIHIKGKMGWVTIFFSVTLKPFEESSSYGRIIISLHKIKNVHTF